jgi:hypothetical protein
MNTLAWPDWYLQIFHGFTGGRLFSFFGQFFFHSDIFYGENE